MQKTSFINKIVKGVCWLLIQLMALIECYLIGFGCICVFSGIAFTVASFFHNPAWLTWVFNHYGLILIIADIPVTAGMFIYLQVALHKEPSPPAVNPVIKNTSE